MRNGESHVLIIPLFSSIKMFQLIKTPIEDLNLRKSFSSPEAGGFCVFEGWVRNHNEGKIVVGLEYEAMEKLCTSEARKIFNEVKGKFEILKAVCYHRVGNLEVGEMAVWVGVSAKHREYAFKACRYIIDEVKIRLPIWKKEYYEDGTSEWVNCQCQDHLKKEKVYL